MTPERWQKVDEVLQDALDRSPAERAAFLSEACLGDEELQRETSSARRRVAARRMAFIIGRCFFVARATVSWTAACGAVLSRKS